MGLFPSFSILSNSWYCSGAELSLAVGLATDSLIRRTALSTDELFPLIGSEGWRDWELLMH